MAEFSVRSLDRLGTCVPELQRVMNEAILEFDFTVLCGHRGREEQERAFREGNSRVHWPHGKHNSVPSKAVDVAPWPVDWDDLVRFGVMAEVILSVAERLGIKLRWGHDWDMDGRLGEKGEWDWPHFEVVD